MSAINSLEPEADAIKAHNDSVVKSFNESLRPVRASLHELADNPLTTDRFKLHAARLINQVVGAVMNCRTEEELADLDGSLSSAHALMGSREIRAIVAAAGNLDSDQQALILRTIGGVSNGNLELQPNGAATRPRLSTGSSQQTQTPPAAAGTGQGQQAAQQPATTTASSQQQPAAAQQGQQSSPVVVQQQPANAQQAPAQGAQAQQPAATNTAQQTQTPPAAAGTGQGQQAAQTGQTAQQPAATPAQPRASRFRRNPR